MSDEGCFWGGFTIGAVSLLVLMLAEEIWHGSDKMANKCFNKKEEMLVRWDIDTIE